MSAELIEFDLQFASSDYLIAGMDEVGRGALAGPVVVGCVSIDHDALQNPISTLLEVDDSKSIPKNRREEMYETLTSLDCLSSGLGQADNGEVDEMGINEATNLAAARAYTDLDLTPQLVLLDRGIDPEIPSTTKTVQGGDSTSVHVAAASIIAKVFRDRLMEQYALEFPTYHWASNVGYGTAQHREAIRDWGLSPLHRRSFSRS